jgi:hypothetical protein
MSHKSYRESLNVITLVLLAGVLLLTGCAYGYKTAVGSERYKPVDVKHVAILLENPKKAYSTIGIVRALGGTMNSDSSVYAKLQKSAADLGADAVIVQGQQNTYLGQQTNGQVIGNSYTATSNATYGVEVKGIAIKYK